jgi:hypothetical protein
MSEESSSGDWFRHWFLAIAYFWGPWKFAIRRMHLSGDS